MRRIRIYHDPDCARCARHARAHRFFDWFDRLDVSTATPATGPLRPGEVMVRELATGRVLAGTDALELICSQIPVYAPMRLLLKIPALRARVDRESMYEVAGYEVPTRRG
ncbi:MAG TPA: hypothetical protein VGH91_06940 [Gammaproteobacteria bacterium]